MPKYLGIDYGAKRIGLAVSDPTGLIATSLRYVDASSDLLDNIENISKEREIDEIVVGLPKNMNGTLGYRAKETISFVDKLKDRVAIPITFWDERVTTMEAKRLLISADVSRKKRKKVIDGMAAQLILQGFLDRIGAK